MDQYERIDLISTALYGSVMKCQHKKTKEMVAIKLVELECAAKKTAKRTKKLLQEDIFIELETNMKIKKMGGHPNIVALKECHMDQHSLALVMEYCANGELLQVLNDQPDIAPFEMMRYFQQITQGVAFLHANGIAHRDLSLENVLINDKDSCQITDFGLAAATNAPHNPSVGKIFYIAPEAYEIRMDPQYTNDKADIWALGVMLFSMFAGKYPFIEANARCSEFRILDEFGIEMLLDKYEVDATGYPELVDLFAKLLTIDPMKRPSSVEILLHPCFTVFKETDHASDTDSIGFSEATTEVLSDQEEDDVSEEQDKDECTEAEEETIEKQQSLETFVSLENKNITPLQVSSFNCFDMKMNVERKKIQTDHVLKAFKSFLGFK